MYTIFCQSPYPMSSSSCVWLCVPNLRRGSLSLDFLPTAEGNAGHIIQGIASVFSLCVIFEYSHAPFNDGDTVW